MVRTGIAIHCTIGTMRLATISDSRGSRALSTASAASLCSNSFLPMLIGPVSSERQHLPVPSCRSATSVVGLVVENV
jgi:hypothetical protein